MRYPAEHKDRTHERIVRAASRRFREHGGEEVAIADLMRDLGLTHGGFYRHFSGKEQLFTEALLDGFRESAARMDAAIAAAPAGRELEAVIHAYLSETHCGRRADGCPMAALTAEVIRHPKGTRAAFAGALRARVDALSRYMPGDTDADRRDALMVLFASMAGALNLARATPDPAVRRRILEKARAVFIQAWRRQP